MAAAPERYVGWINEHVGFNPRGQAHSDFLTACVLDDLRTRCRSIGEGFDSGRLELRQNVGITGRRHVSPLVHAGAESEEDAEIDPNIDGVVLSREGGGEFVVGRISLENKTIMTAHGKARTNRYNDARAYASHVHNSSPSTIAAFAMVINTAATYRNPDAFARSAKVSGLNPPGAAETTIRLFESMRLREQPTDPVGRCEAVLILPIEYDGVSSTARLVTEPPAPSAVARFGYEGFLDRVCRLYQARFAS